MDDNQRWADVVDRLTNLTEANKLTWTVRPDWARGRPTIVGDVYAADAFDKSIAVYEYAYRHYIDEDRWENETEVAIEFVRDDGTIEWRWPATSARWALLNAIRYSRSGAEEFLKTVLGRQ